MSGFRAVSLLDDDYSLQVELTAVRNLWIEISAGSGRDHCFKISNADAHQLADWLSAHGFGTVSDPSVADDASTDLETLRSRADTASDVLNFHRKRIENIEARIAKLEGK